MQASSTIAARMPSTVEGPFSSVDRMLCAAARPATAPDTATMKRSWKRLATATSSAASTPSPHQPVISVNVPVARTP